MEFLKWGKQSNVFGLPIALALIIEAIMNLYGLAHSTYLFEARPVVVNVLGLGTVYSEFTTDLARIYSISRTVICTCWGFLTLLNVLVLTRAAVLARITLSCACLYFVHAVFGVIYGFVLYFRGSYLEFNEELASRFMLTPFPWNTHFWVTSVVNIAVYSLFAVIALDMHLSFFNILQAGGSGWESKAHYQITPDLDESTPLT